MNGVLILATYQFDPILQIRPSLLPGRLISQGYHNGINSLVVVCTTRNTKGVQAVKKHTICTVEGRDIICPVSGALIEVKRTVGRLGILI